MSLRTKVREQLYELHLYRGGRVPVEGLRGLLQAIENIQGHNVSVPDLKISFLAAQTGVASAAILTGTGRVYGVWALSGTLAAAALTSPPNTATQDVVFQVLDNTVVQASGKVAKNKAAEVYFFNSDDGVGIKFATSLKVAAVQASDGTTSATGVNAPDLVVIWGDDTVNTADANLINTNYG